MKKQILVMHGGGSFVGIPRERLVEELRTKTVDLERLRRGLDWKATLQVQLGDVYDVLSPKMPNPDAPRYEEWRAWFENILSNLDQNLILVGHSLGGLFLLKYFAEHESDKNILGLFAVAPPYVVNDSKWKGSGFSLTGDFSRLENIRHIFLYHAKDDQVVPFEDLEKFTRAVPHASARALDGRGHFIDDNLPEIVGDIKSL